MMGLAGMPLSVIFLQLDVPRVLFCQVRCLATAAWGWLGLDAQGRGFGPGVTAE